MIERYQQEEYLPCNLKEIVYNTGFVKIDINKKYFIVGNITIIPLNSGYIIYNENGDIYRGDELSLLVLKKIEDSIYSYNLDELKEMESLHYFKIITEHSQNNRGKISIINIPERYKELYDNNYGWFSYIPLVLEFDLTNKCNYKCIHCLNDSSIQVDTTKEMKLDKMKTLLEEAKQLGTYSVSFMGGEPLMFKDFWNISTYASTLNFNSLRLTTNGYLLNDEYIDKISEIYNFVQMSLHGSNSNTNNLIVNKRNGFDKAFNAATKLSKKNVRIRLNYVVMEQNVEEIEEFASMISQTNIKELRFTILANVGRASNMKSWNDYEVTSIAERILILQNKYKEQGLKILSSGFPISLNISENATFYGCVAGRTLLYINPSGLLSSCPMIFQEDLSNFNNNILNTWHNEYFRKIRVMPKCDCSFAPICGGTCVA